MTDGTAFFQLEEEFRQAFEMHGHRPAAQHADQLPAPAPRRECRGAGRRNDAGFRARHDPHPVVAQDQCARRCTRSSSPTRCRSVRRRSARRISRLRSNARSDFVIPYDQKAAAKAAKLGQTFADANRSTKAGCGYARHRQGGAGRGRRRCRRSQGNREQSSLLGKFDLKSLLSKKPKAKSRTTEPAE